MATENAERLARKEQIALDRKMRMQEKKTKEDIAFKELEVILDERIEASRVRKEFLHNLDVLKLDHLTNENIVTHVMDFSKKIKQMYDYHRKVSFLSIYRNI